MARDSKSKRLYVSLPITGYSYEEVKERCSKARIKYQSKGFIVITPIDVITDTSFPYSMCMGKCVEALLESDTILLLQGWSDSRGCRSEYEIARIYGIEILTDGHI